METNYLATTSLDKFNYKNTYYLSSYSLNKTNADLTKKKFICKNYINKKNNKEKNINYIIKISNEIIDDLFKVLKNKEKLTIDKKQLYIFIYPWILIFVSICHDRWSQVNFFLRKFKKKNFLLNEYDLHPSSFICDGDTSFHLATQRNDFNYYLFYRIFKFLDRKNIHFKKKKLMFKETEIYSSKKNLSLINKFFRYIDDLLSKIFFNFNDIYFDIFVYPTSQFFKLCFKLRIFPVRNVNLFGFNTKNNYNFNLRSDLKYQLEKNSKSKDNFRSFMRTIIFEYLPSNYLENISILDNKIKKYSKFKKIIIATQSLNFSEKFRFFLAKTFNRGSKLIYVEHGGGLKSKYFTMLNYLDKYFFKIVVWYKNKKATDKKIQMSPTINLFKKLQRDNPKKLTFFFTESFRYVAGVQSYPTFDQANDYFDKMLSMLSSLPISIKKNILFRNKANFGMNCSERFVNKFSIKQLDGTKQKIKSEVFGTFNKTKLAIVSYPQTIYSQIMYLNIPVLLVCDPKQFYLENDSFKLFKDLEKNKMAFSDYLKAKNHIIKNWKNIESWWKNKKIQAIRKKYLNDYFNVQDNWEKEWFNFVFKQRKHLLN